MAIYGVAILAGCFVVGMFFGEIIGTIMGVDSNVGGVGIAMLLLIVVVDKLQKKGMLSMPAQSGLAFWNAMYIPIVIAMAASQNVLGALTGGPLAIIAGVAAVVISWTVVPLLSGKKARESAVEFNQSHPLKTQEVK
ncbi:malonate transporter subunit MadL [Mammaliicoccus sciuri]|uniref:Malonate transporter, MadL subunit n=1 Tax=Sporosarcina newyorkensis TaxID=759851 RepID=A0A1T4YB08_9BACL|nr:MULTISPECIES: malonate transporter subunit MadL [Sporosarcina]MBY0223631.1 malonate transporter subunit MadL [Sporosarcina aquimarina]SKA98994.1 malonate transporter, MadL subunit [Sporosarcina newyorkensis]